MSDDLVVFLNARLDEDEAVAKAAAEADGADWFVGSAEDYDQRSILHEGPSTLYVGLMAEYRVADRIAEETAPHIARHDPARVLREVEADRLTIAACVAAGAHWDDPDGYPAAVLARAVLRLRAAVYSDHLDYRPEWKP